MPNIDNMYALLRDNGYFRGKPVFMDGIYDLINNYHLDNNSIEKMIRLLIFIVVKGIGNKKNGVFITEELFTLVAPLFKNRFDMLSIPLKTREDLEKFLNNTNGATLDISYSSLNRDILDFIEKSNPRITSLIPAYRELAEHYVFSYFFLDRSDLAIIRKNLKTLGLHRELIEKVNYALESHILNGKRDNQSVLSPIDKYKSKIEEYCQELVESGQMNTKELQNAGALYCFLSNTRRAILSKTMLIDLSILSPTLNTSDFTKQEICEILLYILRCNVFANMHLNYCLGKRRKDVDEFTYDAKSGINYARQYSKYYLDHFMSGTNFCNKIFDLKGEISVDIFENTFKFGFVDILEEYHKSEDITNPAHFQEKLCALGLDPSLANAFCSWWEYEIDDESTPTLELLMQSIGEAENPINQPEGINLKKKDRNIIYRELEKYFNFDTMTSFKYLSMNEVLYCMRLAIIVGMEEEIIENFLDKTRKFNSTVRIGSSFQVVSQYLDLRGKLEFYKSDERIKEILEAIEEAYEEYRNTNNQDDRILYSEIIAEELDKALNIIGDSILYEQEFVGPVLPKEYIIKQI